jgi:hypothetical protein
VRLRVIFVRRDSSGARRLAVSRAGIDKAFGLRPEAGGWAVAGRQRKKERET